MKKSKLLKKSEVGFGYTSKEQVESFHEQIKKSIFSKIPQLNGAVEIYLPLTYFKQLTDEEFAVLWHLPGLRIKVNEETAKAIEERRRLLGLKRGEQSQVVWPKKTT